MKDNKEYQDHFIEKLLKDAPKEEAPAGFTDSVMKQLLAEEGATLQYKPLIAPWVWYMLGGFVCALFVLSGTGMVEWADSGIGSFPDSGLSVLDLSSFSLPQVPPNLVYGLMAFSAFALLHLYWINGRIQRRFGY